MKKEYKTPIFEMSKLELVDVITTSMPVQEGFIGQEGNDDDWWSEDFL